MDIRAEILRILRDLRSTTTEDSALKLLALRNSQADPLPLLRQQLFSGAWAAIPSTGLPNAYCTSLALIALEPYRTPAIDQAAERAFEFLEGLHGRESHWLWQWKFRLFDRQVRFDPSKSGWPWVPGTVSWVAPTALAILAFRTWRRQSPRIAAGIDMLLDRVCPRGGWNAGNSVVFGVELDPHPDFTAMAAVALRDSLLNRGEVIERSLNYLVTRLSASHSPYSLAWGAIALSSYGHEDVNLLRPRLEANLLRQIAVLPARILALAALALEIPTFIYAEAAQ